MYALLLALVLFSPSSQVQSNLVADLADLLRRPLPDAWVSFERVEVLMNAVIIAPLTFLGSMVVPRLRWQEWTAYAFLGAVVVEVLQGVLLPDRQASFSDIVANAAGGCAGAVLHLGLRRRAPAGTVPR